MQTYVYKTKEQCYFLSTKGRFNYILQRMLEERRYKKAQIFPGNFITCSFILFRLW